MSLYHHLLLQNQAHYTTFNKYTMEDVMNNHWKELFYLVSLFLVWKTADFKV